MLIRAAEQTEADIVLDNQFVVDPTSKRVIFLAIEPPKDEVVILEFSAFLRNVQSSTFFDFGYLKPIIRRRWLEANGIKYREKLRLGEDLMFLMDCYAHRANVILVSKPYYYYCFQYSQKVEQCPQPQELKPGTNHYWPRWNCTSKKMLVGSRILSVV